VLRGSSKEFQWTEKQQEAFEAAKGAVASAVKLAHPRSTAVLALATGASDYHVGGVLQQQVGKDWQLLAFFSKLTSTQQRYSTFDRELLAAFLALQHFRFWLEGRSFQLHTDHKPLIAAVKRISPPSSSTPSHSTPSPSTHSPSTPSSSTPSPSAIFLSSTSTCSPVAVEVNAVGVQKPVDYLDMAVRQIVCPDVAHMRQSTCLQLQAMRLKNCQLWGDVSTGHFRPLVPADLRRDVFEAIHGAAHPGMHTMCRLMASKFVWPGMAKQVRE
jgi:RNase H-like domain found in reverse transcriptase/Integrase zinc binding domain